MKKDEAEKLLVRFECAIKGLSANVDSGPYLNEINAQREQQAYNAARDALFEGLTQSPPSSSDD